VYALESLAPDDSYRLYRRFTDRLTASDADTDEVAVSTWSVDGYETIRILI
jgi:hypothetical protein